MMVNVQKILRILTTDGLVKNAGICAMDVSCPFRLRGIGMVGDVHILKCCDAARPNQTVITSAYI